MKKSILPIALLLVIAACVGPALAGPYEEEKKEAEKYAKDLILRRSALSKSLARGGDISEEAFIKTYGKIYEEIQDIRGKKGYIITFSSIKPRNPQNAATPFEARLISRFRTDRAFRRFWTVTMVQGRSYSRLVMPVFAKKSCLSCHGAREKRPAFIERRYPDDKSTGFKEGEIMGIISLYMPDEEE